MGQTHPKHVETTMTDQRDTTNEVNMPTWMPRTLPEASAFKAKASPLPACDMGDVAGPQPKMETARLRTGWDDEAFD